MDRSVAWAQIVATEWTSQKKIGHLLLRMTAGELHLRCGSEVKERRLQRLGHGVAKVCFSIEGTEQVLKLVPKAGQNRQGWHSGGLNDPIAEFKVWKMAWAKHESLRPHLPYYSEAFLSWRHIGWGVDLSSRHVGWGVDGARRRGWRHDLHASRQDCGRYLPAGRRAILHTRCLAGALPLVG